MTTSCTKTGEDPIPETSGISDLPQTNKNVQHNIGIFNQYRVSLNINFVCKCLQSDRHVNASITSRM